MTIRRDFDVLEEQGLVERTHGGAVFRQERVPLKQIDVLITNRRLSANFQNELDSSRVRVDIA